MKNKKKIIDSTHIYNVFYNKHNKLLHITGTMDKKLFIKTMGCQMNVYDSRKMADVLAPLGYKQVETPEGADLIVLNTCHIREKATEKVFSELGRLRPHKENSDKKVLIAVAGCVAQAEGDIITKRAKYVDMVFGPQTYHKLPQMILEANGNERVVNTDFPAESKFDSLPKGTEESDYCAFLAVQEGCDKFCTYCVVPYTRGSEYSRPYTQIIDEAKALVDKGVKDITLLGQNVNNYNNEINFAELIRKVAEVDGVERIRYTTSYPSDINSDLINAHRYVEKLMPYIHLPIQSGSNRILELMNRKHTAEFYLETIEKLRKARPDIAISSDFIVGFPGESDEDFQDTMRLVEKVGYTTTYSFKFSARPGTPAAAMKGLVPEHVKDARLAELQALLVQQQIDFNKDFLGKHVDVLIDGTGRHKGQVMGRSPYMQSVYTEGSSKLLGSTVKVRITNTSQNSLSGIIV